MTTMSDLERAAEFKTRQDDEELKPRHLFWLASLPSLGCVILVLLASLLVASLREASSLSAVWQIPALLAVSAGAVMMAGLAFGILNKAVSDGLDS